MTTTTELDEMKEIVDDFLVEANELITSLDENLVRLEEAPCDLGLLNTIFRAAHTIKGTSGFIGLDLITSLTHSMEDVLNKLRKAELAVTPEIMDIVLRSVDALKLLLADVADGRESTLDVEPLRTQLAAIITGQGSSSSQTGTSMNEVEPTSISPIPAKPTKPAKSAKESAERKVVDQTIRVDVERLDKLMNLVGELVLERNALMQASNQLTRDHEGSAGVDHLNRTSTQINFITTEIQLAVMKMRMLPIGKVFGKFPRLVRDLARDTGKKIDLEISGEETELDRSVIEEIGDPLIHLVRNSCDHGIERTDERLAAGKPETGLVQLIAAQEGSHIVITITDDGRGLDIAAIKAKAIERGLATSENVNHLSDKEIFTFIFLPGFSTAKNVTDISGRGVGMDVVRTNIEKLKGLIDIESTPEQGCRISIKLPLTLAIVQGLLVTSEGETFVIPLASVIETVRATDTQIKTVNFREVMILRDGVLPLIHLGRILRRQTSTTGRTGKAYVVVVGLADRRLGILVDGLLGQEEVVIKAMGTFLGTTMGIAGATIAGDGRVRLILDMTGLFQLSRIEGGERT